MPRPPRCRRICDAPQVDTFCPQGHEEAAPILLTLDEYEVIRLVDLEQRTHQQCAAQMDISRSTVQEIYESAGARSPRALYMAESSSSPAAATASAAGRSRRAAHSAAGQNQKKPIRICNNTKEKQT